MLNGAEVVFKCHRLHGSGEIELKVLEKVLGFCVECTGGERGQRLVEASRGPV